MCWEDGTAQLLGTEAPTLGTLADLTLYISSSGCLFVFFKIAFIINCNKEGVLGTPSRSCLVRCFRGLGLVTGGKEGAVL